MKIFTHEFKAFVKSNLVCRFRGHRPGKWVDEYWAIAHATGNQIKVCQFCGKIVARTKPKWEKDLERNTTSASSEKQR